MIQYIYFVKCPNCEDEHFDFFDEAKDFALSCLSQKPVITQTEVDRNDFGECTDSHDLGTVWSWEDMMDEGGYTEAEPTKSIFTKDDLKLMADGQDPEFDAIDNSVDFEVDEIPDNFRKPMIESFATNEFEIPGFEASVAGEFEDEGVKGYNIIYSKNGTDIVEVEVWEADAPVTVNDNLYAPNLMDRIYDSFESFSADLNYKVGRYVKECFERKPIPEGMTIEQLVEEMEENEDTVECAWCEELFDKSECRKEVDLGWLCSRCQSAIMSRGESLTFKEGNYWDFLDEDVELTEGKYDFPHLTIGDDKLTPEELSTAKSEIIAKLEERGFIRNGVLMLPLVTNFNVKMWITDIAIVGGKIEVVVKKSHLNYGSDTPVESYVNWELKKAIAEVKDLKRTYGVRDVKRPLEFLNVLTEVAGEVNAAHNLGVSGRNDRRVAARVSTMTPEVAAELKAYINYIDYYIPPHGEYTVEDILDIDPEADESLAEKAANRLNQIYNSFYNLPFAVDAVNANMVEERVPNENAGWLTQWGGTGKIHFNGPISALSQDAQDIIESSRMSGKKLDTSAKVVDCYRLANALIRRFGDAKQFSKKTLGVSEDLKQAACPTCGKHESFDAETSFCNDCGFQ